MVMFTWIVYITGVLCFTCVIEGADYGGFFIKKTKGCSVRSLNLNCDNNEVIMLLKVKVDKRNGNCNKAGCAKDLKVFNVTMYKTMIKRCAGKRSCVLNLDSTLPSLRCGIANYIESEHICVLRPLSVKTKEGNAGGAYCVFPFIYKGQSYSECTDVNNKGKLWCATTSNYTRDEKWGNCMGESQVISMCKNQTFNLNKGVLLSNGYPHLTSLWPQHRLTSSQLQPQSVWPEHKCECKMEVDGDDIKLQLIEMDLTETCSHKLVVEDGNNNRDYIYDCGSGYKSKMDVVKKSNAIKLTFVTYQSSQQSSEKGARFALAFRKISSVAIDSKPKIKVQCREYLPQLPPRSTTPPPQPPTTVPNRPPTSAMRTKNPPIVQTTEPPQNTDPTVGMVTTQSFDKTTIDVATGLNEKNPAKQSGQGGVIGGSISGAVAVLVLIGVVVFIVLRCRKPSDKTNSTSFDNIGPSYSNKGYETDQSDSVYHNPENNYEYQYAAATSNLNNYESTVHTAGKESVYDKLDNGRSFGNAIYSEPTITGGENVYDCLDERHAKYQNKNTETHYYSGEDVTVMQQNSLYNTKPNTEPVYNELESGGGTAHSNAQHHGNSDPNYFELKSDNRQAQPSAPSMDTIGRPPTYLELEKN